MSAVDFTTTITHWDQKWGQQFPVRLIRKQKDAFLHEIEQELQARGLAMEHIKARHLLHNHNLVTVCEKPQIIFTAHYDTPTIAPFWLSALLNLIGHTRQITAMLVLLGILWAPLLLQIVLPTYIPTLNFLFNALAILIALSFITLFIPNPHNREDNTSGVIGLMALADWLKDKPDMQQVVQLAFLDNEEWGLLGSNSLRQVWDQQRHPYKEAMIINLDCISRGRVPLLAYHKKGHVAERLLPYLRQVMPQTICLDMKWLPLSDNFTFKELGAVDISFVDPSLIPGGYVIRRIHAPSDNNFDPPHTALLINALTSFINAQVR